MQQHTTATAWGAIALGVVCFVGTMVILFWEFVEKGSLSGFNQTHVYILLALAVAYVTGHLTFETRGGWRIVFGSLFAVASVICVGLSGAQTSQSMDLREAKVTDSSGKRKRLVENIAEADAARKAARMAADTSAAEFKTAIASAAADYKSAAKLAADACKAKVYCKRMSEAAELAQKVLSQAREGAREASLQGEHRVRDAENHHRDLSSQLSKLAAPAVANAAMHKLAAILTLGYGGASVLPYLFGFLTEFGSVSSFTYGFRLLMQRSAAAAETVAGEQRKPSKTGGPPRGGRKPRKPKAVLRSTVNRQPSSTVVNGPWRAKSMNEPKALAFVQARLAGGGEFPSQDAIAAHVGVTKSAVSKWVVRWERQGLIAREKDGRCKVISLPARATA